MVGLQELRKQLARDLLSEFTMHFTDILWIVTSSNTAPTYQKYIGIQCMKRERA